MRAACVGLALLLGAAALPAEDLTRRVGAYQWSGAWPRKDGGLLTAAQRKASGLGMGVFRLYLGARYDYRQPLMSPRRFEEAARPLTPAAIAALPRYAAVFEDAAFETIVLTVYAVADYGGGPDDLNLQRPWGAGEAEAERRQIGELCDLLYERYGGTGKTIVLANHETDEKLMDILNYTGDADLAVSNIASWINARQEAVEAARDRWPEARLRILHAFEIAAVNLHIGKVRGSYAKTARGEGWNALRDIAPLIRCDLVSYSAYESANSPYDTLRADTPPEETAARLTRDLDRIRSLAADSISPLGRSVFGAEFVMIGELGFARERFEPLDSGGVLPRLYHALRAALGWGCPYVILWQVYDAPRRGGEPLGFGLFDAAGNAPRLASNQGCQSVEGCLKLAYSRGLDAWGAANGY